MCAHVHVTKPFCTLAMLQCYQSATKVRTNNKVSVLEGEKKKNQALYTKTHFPLLTAATEQQLLSKKNSAVPELNSPFV